MLLHVIQPTGTMARKSIALLLTLFIGLSPVMSAFADCLESNHATSAQTSSSSGTAEEPAAMLVTAHDQDADGHGSRENAGCHTDSSCVFHLCGGLGLIGSIRFTASLSSYQDILPIRASLNGRTCAPELEPPIRIL